MRRLLLPALLLLITACGGDKPGTTANAGTDAAGDALASAIDPVQKSYGPPYKAVGMGGDYTANKAGYMTGVYLRQFDMEPQPRSLSASLRAATPPAAHRSARRSASSRGRPQRPCAG